MQVECRLKGRLNAKDTGGINIMSEGGCAVRFRNSDSSKIRKLLTEDGAAVGTFEMFTGQCCF